MKAKLFLLKLNQDSQQRYPICIELIHGKQRKRKKIGASLLAHWNFDNNTPTKMHPNFNMLMPILMEYNAKIFDINFGNYDFSRAADFLFSNTDSNTSDFYQAGLSICDNTTTGKLFKTVLNSFNGFAPGIKSDAITPQLAEKYMQYLSLKNKPNGVHTYMRKLNTIYNRVGNGANPFKGVRPKRVKTPKKGLLDSDVLKLINTRTITTKFDGKNTNQTINYPRYYWLLMFYLGGIDFVDLAALRYDQHVIDGRVQFNRSKGGTDAYVNNIIPKSAHEILKHFNCYPYLIPAFKYTDYKSFVNKCNTNLHQRTQDLQLSKKPLTKSARATFIDRAQQLLVDQRITMEIVGHTDNSVHAIYTDSFPLQVRDTAHLKIIAVTDL